MKLEKSKGNRYRPPRVLIPYLILAAGLILTIVVSYYYSKIAETEDQARFKNSVMEIDAAIESRIETYTALLRAGRLQWMYLSCDDKPARRLENQPVHGRDQFPARE